MNFKNITLATAAAASLLVAVPNATAQERGPQTPPRTERVQEADATRRGADEVRTAGDAVKQDARTDAKAEVKDAKAERAAAMAAAKKEEKKHRENLAKITRLRTIFTERGAAAQLRKLEGAEQREGVRYAKVLELGKARMGADLAGEVRTMRDKGKTRGEVKRTQNAREGAADAADKTRGEVKRTENAREGAADAAKDAGKSRGEVKRTENAREGAA
ncbi:MAG: hypothetical protein ACI9C2_001394, partial [Gammaproteobacteria bacterium]